MPDTDQIEVTNPSGVVGNIPPEQVDKALGAGYKLNKHVVMYSPQGDKGLVPKEQLRAAGKAGYNTTPATDTEAKAAGNKSFSTAAWDTIKGMVKDPTEGRSVTDPKFWYDPSKASFDPAHGSLAEAGGEVKNEYQRSRAAGSNPVAAAASGAVAGAGSMLGVSNKREMEQAERGATGEIAGEAAVPAGFALSGLASEGLGALGKTKAISTVGDVASKALNYIPKKMGLATPEAPKALTQAIQPGVNIPRAQESINIAGPRLQQVRQANGLDFKNTGDLLEGIKTAKQTVHGAIEERLGPVAELSPDTSQVADAMRNSISKRTAAQFPAAAKAIENRASTYRGNMKLADIEKNIQEANNDLRNFYKRPMATDSPIGPDTAATQAEVQALRKLLDEKIQGLTGEEIKPLKREYGALRDVERATARQHAIASRVKGASLWEGLAALHAAGDFMSGNLLGAAKGAGTLAIGQRLKSLRDPNYLIEQAFHGKQAFQPAAEIPKFTMPPPKGLLPKPATEMGGGADTSGSVRSGRYTTPAALLPEEKPIEAEFIPRRVPTGPTRLGVNRMLPSGEPRQTNIPPIVDERFARESTLPPDATRLGTTGEAGVRVPIKGLLPAAREAAGIPAKPKAAAPVAPKPEIVPAPKMEPSKAFNQEAVKAAKTPTAAERYDAGLKKEYAAGGPQPKYTETLAPKPTPEAAPAAKQEETKPAPKPVSNRMAGEAIKRIDADLVQKAKNKAIIENNDHMQTLTGAMGRSGKISPADRQLLNNYLEIPEGTKVEVPPKSNATYLPKREPAQEFQERVSDLTRRIVAAESGEKQAIANRMSREEAKAVWERINMAPGHDTLAMKHLQERLRSRSETELPSYPDIEKLSRAEMEKELPQVRDRITQLKQDLRSASSPHREGMIEQLNREYDRAGKLQTAMESNDTRAAKAAEKTSKRDAVAKAKKDAAEAEETDRKNTRDLVPEGGGKDLSQKDFYKAALKSVGDAWEEKLGPEGMDEARRLTDKAAVGRGKFARGEENVHKANLELPKPEGFPENKLHLKVPGDGEFTFLNRPGVVERMRSMVDQLFAKGGLKRPTPERYTKLSVKGPTAKQLQDSITRTEERIEFAQKNYKNPDHGPNSATITYQELQDFLAAERENLNGMKEHLTELRGKQTGESGK